MWGRRSTHQNTLAELGRHALGDRQAEESGADDEEVKAAGGLERSDPGISGAVIGSKGIRRMGRHPNACSARLNARAPLRQVAIRSRFRIVTLVH